MKKIVSIIISALMITAVTVTAFAETDEVITTVGVILKGDINGDGEANNKDVVELFRYASGNKKADDETAYDFNGDKEVNNKDVVELFRYLSAK